MNHQSSLQTYNFKNILAINHISILKITTKDIISLIKF